MPKPHEKTSAFGRSSKHPEQSTLRISAPFAFRRLRLLVAHPPDEAGPSVFGAREGVCGRR